MYNNYSWNLGGGAYIAHFGKGHDENPPGRGSGRYPWGSGEKNKKKGIFGLFSKKKKMDLKDWDPWNNRKQMQDLVTRYRKQKFFYESQIDNPDKYKSQYARNILNRPISEVQYYQDSSKAKNVVDWLFNKKQRTYAKEFLDKRDEYTQKILDMRLKDAPNQDVIDFMLYYGMSNYMGNGKLVYPGE